VGAGPGLCPALVESDGRRRSSPSWSSSVYSVTVDTLNGDKDHVVFVQKRVHAVQRTVLFCFFSRGDVRHDVIKKAIYGGVTCMRIIKHKRYGIHPFFLFTLDQGCQQGGFTYNMPCRFIGPTRSTLCKGSKMLHMYRASGVIY
jgi:hypothetical protein